VGRAGWAYDCLLQFAEHWVAPNGLHFNVELHDAGVSVYRRHDSGRAPGPFTIEANCAVSAGISGMLLQGWGDTLRVFPSIPEHWRDVAFRSLRAEGAFQVSAIRRDGRTVWVKIVAGAERRVRLKAPFDGRPVTVVGAELVREGKHFLGTLRKGQEVVLSAAEESISMEQAVLLIRASRAPRLGLI